MLQDEDADAIHKAQHARSRLPAKNPLVQGTIVYVWRSSRKVRGWVGPGVVVCINPQETSACVSMRGVVVKCSMDRVRRATDEEWLGADLLTHLQYDMKSKLARSGERGYIDTDNESLPVEDDEPADSQP